MRSNMRQVFLTSQSCGYTVCDQQFRGAMAPNYTAHSLHGTTYFLVITAHDAIGDESAFSNGVNKMK